MFGYSEQELLESYLAYPQFHHVSLRGMMNLIILSAFPMMNDAEREEMDLLKWKYEQHLEKLKRETENKEKTASACMKLLFDALSLYDRSFDRLADSYFDVIYS